MGIRTKIQLDIDREEFFSRLTAKELVKHLILHCNVFVFLVGESNFVIMFS